MGEGEPVGAVGEEWVAEAGIAEGIAHFRNPKDNRAWHDGMRVKEGCEPAGFMLEWKSCESTEDESQDEEREPEADRTKKLRFGLKRRHLWDGSLPGSFPTRIWV
jgi:hypothetical protein